MISRVQPQWSTHTSHIIRNTCLTGHLLPLWPISIKSTFGPLIIYCVGTSTAHCDVFVFMGSDKTFFFNCTLLNSLIGLWKCDDSTRLFSQYSNHTSASDTIQCIWITNTHWEMLAEPGWAQTGWLEWIYEHNQLFKPQLFTDNLLTIQLFILRQRPSPSH